MPEVQEPVMELRCGPRNSDSKGRCLAAPHTANEARRAIFSRPPDGTFLLFLMLVFVFSSAFLDLGLHPAGALTASAPVLCGLMAGRIAAPCVACSLSLRVPRPFAPLTPTNA